MNPAKINPFGNCSWEYNSVYLSLLKRKDAKVYCFCKKVQARQL